MPDLTLNDSPFASQIFANISLFDSLIQSDLGYPQLRMYGWEQLKERAVVGPLNIPMMMRQVEQEALASGKPLLENVNELFEKFAARLAPEFEIAQVPVADRKVTELQLGALQERLREHYENTALETMWNACLLGQFQDQGAFAQEAPPSGHQAIRQWLNNPVNQPRIQQITEFGPAGSGLMRLGLRALPPEIGLFTRLTTLNLSFNQLTFLPESFGNLQALSELDLSNNKLASLPESFGNLQALSGLSLSNNKLASLPESFGNLQALSRLSLNVNPWMLASDKEPHKIIDYQTYLALLGPLKKYTPQSPLATLFHAIIFNKPDEAIQQAYAQLSPEMQQRIAVLVTQHPTYSGPDLSTAESSSSTSSSSSSSSSDPSPSHDNLFTDIGLFARSVRKATYNLYDSLEQEHKKLVHWHVWDLAGRPETDDPQWGEHHAFDHVLRFTDALEKATQN